jgi:hypothetical protein
MNKPANHPFFPPADSERLERSLAHTEYGLDGPYPDEMLQRYFILFLYRWKDHVLQKMVQNEFANRTIRKLEGEIQQYKSDKLADSCLIEDLKRQTLMLEKELESKAELIKDLNNTLASSKANLEAAILKDLDNQQKNIRFCSTLEE